MTNTSQDLISNLPDSLILHFLSFLPIKYVIRTSILSKRWRYLWRSARSLDFSEAYEDTINYINRSLILHEATRISKFSSSVMYENSYAGHVDAWINFAVRRGVEELMLHFFDGTWWYGNPSLDDIQSYELPPYLFSCQSLVKLALHVCRLRCSSSFQLSSLKTLYLQQVFITGGGLQTLISSCPLLENLGLAFCNRSDSLAIRHERHLRSLSIEDLYYELENLSPMGPPISIYAPRLLSFELKGNRPQTDYKLLNVASIVSASINFELSLDIFGISYFASSRDLRILKKLLEDVSHVKYLRLCTYCIQILSMSRVQHVDTLRLNSAYLELNTEMRSWDIPGIVHLLKSFSNLEMLTLRLDKKLLLGNWEAAAQERRGFDEREYWKTLGHCFSQLLKRLSLVNFYGFMGGDNSGKMEKGAEGVNRFLGSHHRELQFVNILLRNSMMLQTLKIIMTNEWSFNSWSEKSQLLMKLKDKLLAFPRASPIAKVCVVEG